MLEQNLHNPGETFLTPRPYPGHLQKEARLKNGKSTTIRPIRPEDESLLVQFHQTLSDQSVYFRYFHMIGLKQRIDHERLSHICHIDYATEMVLIAEDVKSQTGQVEVIGVARLNKIPGTREAEFAILISDACQGLGLGTEMLRRLIEIGRMDHLTAIFGDIHLENKVMQMVCRKMGFQLAYSPEDHFFLAKLNL
jgi:acetyltransferase